MDNVNPVEEIAYIKRVMQDSKRIIIEDGKGFIFWGILVTIGLLITFFNFKFHWTLNIFLTWMILIGAGWIFTFIFEVKQGRKAKVKTLAGKILGAVWISAGIVMTMVGFVGTAAGAYSGVYISPLISAILGIAYYVSGVVYEYKWISMLSLGWWSGAVVMFIWPSVYTLLIFASMMILFQIIPGVILYIKYKNEAESKK